MQVKIYQINHERDYQGVKFQSMDRLEKFQGTKQINAAIYDEVFAGELPCNDLEEVFVLFNRGVGHPLMRGHSLSVSDVVVKEDGAYFCDSTVFTKVDFDESQTQKPDNLLKIVFVQPNKSPIIAELENSDLAIRRAVSGAREDISNGDGTVLICNRDGKYNRLDGNRRIENDVIAGDFFVAGAKGPVNLRSLTEKEQEKYMQRFAEIEDISQEEVEGKLKIDFYPMSQ